MPKIPTFESQGRPTAEVGGVKSNVQVPFETSFTKIGSTIADYYVKEKTAEADTKALKILSDSYGNQEDGTQGLYSINDELKKNGNPSQVSQLFDERINNLWNSIQNNKLSDADNFTKKALQQKFFAQAAAFRQDTIKGSRDTLFSDQTNIFGTYAQQQTINLKTQGAAYLPTFNESIKTEASKIALLEPYQQQELLKTSINFGHKELAQTLIENKDTYTFEQLVKNGSLKLDSKTYSELIDKSMKVKEETTFNKLSAGLDVQAGTSTPMGIQKAANDAKTGTFGGDLEKVKMFESLQPGQKEKFFEFIDKKKREAFSEIKNINDATVNNERVEAINKSMNLYSDVVKTNGIVDKTKVINYFGNTKENTVQENTKQQFIDLSVRQGNDELKKVSNYYMNNEITNKILNGDVKDVSTPFILTGEDTPKSLLQRTGNGVNMDVDLKFYLSYLLPNINNKGFIDDQKQFLKFIEKYSPAVEGVKYARYLDIQADDRLNKFKNDMLTKFIQGRETKITANELLDYKSKNFIGTNFNSYLANPREIEQSLNEALKNNNTTQDAFAIKKETVPLRLKNETVPDYIKRIGK
jgi:hypothetical protein